MQLELKGKVFMVRILNDTTYQGVIMKVCQQSEQNQLLLLVDKCNN